MNLTPLGDAVRKSRKARGWTIVGLAERSGVSQRFLSELERGRGNISIRRLMQVADALSVPLRELVGPLDDARAAHARPIALVGLRGAGKTSVGKRLAESLKVTFVELDRQIEAKAGLPLGQIFEMHGEAYYRRLERESIEQLLDAGVLAVIAVGGGVVNDSQSWALLKDRCWTVWLKARPEQHYQRVMAQGDLRPMKNRPAAMAELRALLAARTASYAEADLTVDTAELTVAEVSEEVLSRRPTD